MTNQAWRRCDFVDVLHQHLSIPRPQCLDILNELVALITQELQQGTKIAILNFGTFSLRHKRARMGRNPKTKQEIMISARTTVSFRPALMLRKHVRQGKDNDLNIDKMN